jgi:predicted SprT family Zn-dependent metalloprotease
MTNIQELIREEFNRIDALARTISPAYASKPVPRLTFFTKGKTAGLAKFGSHWEVSINTFVASQNHDMMINTVSHEIAHMVVAAENYNDHGHGRYWKMVHRALGGNAQRCYAAESVKTIAGRKSTWYLYETLCGVQHWVGPRFHSGLQSGKYNYLTVRESGQRLYESNWTGKHEIRG